jgi:hypothetical protein
MEQDIQTRLAGAGDSLVVDALAARVFSALTAHGVQCRLLKGASFAQWLYDEGEVRAYVDCDFLVRPGDLKRAEEILRRRGFSLHEAQFADGDRPWYHTTWVDPGTNRTVELHRTLLGVTADDEVVWTALAEPKSSLVVAGRTVDALSLPARALHVALHRAQHGPLHSRCREDLSRALQRVSPREWEAAAELASRTGATQAFAFGLRCDPLGERIASGLGLPYGASTEVLLRGAGSPHLALGFEWFASRQGVRAKVAFLLRKGFPPPAFLRAWIRVIRGRPLVLPLAYVWRLGWLLRHAPAGYRAWRQTERKALDGPPGSEL